MLYIKLSLRIQILACVRNSVRFESVRTVQNTRPVERKGCPHNAPHAQLFLQIEFADHLGYSYERGNRDFPTSTRLPLKGTKG